MARYDVTERTMRRNGHKPTTRIHITRTQENGRTSVWEFSPTALRALADQIEDALEPHEKEA